MPRHEAIERVASETLDQKIGAGAGLLSDPEFKLIDDGRRVPTYYAGAFVRFRQVNPDNGWLPVSCFVLGLEVLGVAQERWPDFVGAIAGAVEDGHARMRVAGEEW